MLICNAYSARGRKKENQDSFFLSSAISQLKHESTLVALLADGVSSCKKPKLASELCTRIFSNNLLTQDLCDSNIETKISSALIEANDALYFTDHYERQPALLSTLSGVIFKNNKAHIINVGDSRVYRFYHDTLECLTQDQQHTQGFYKGALASALGADSSIQGQYYSRHLIPGESYFIATDGVYENISSYELKSFILQAQKIKDVSALNKITQQVCQAAYENGSHDNLTCMMVHIPKTQNTAPTLRKNFSTNYKKKFPPPLNPGEQLDQFKIIREITSSPRSQIYLAEDTKTLEKRVIKTPSEYFNDDKVYISRFFKEEKIGLSFDHQSILKFYPTPLNSQYIYHVMEYIEGQTLRGYIDQNAPLSLSVTLELIEKIIISLRVLHRSHILHQDLKPENIMLTNTGVIKIIDLGSTASLVLQDNSNTPPGTLEYTAPEYYSAKPKGVYSDLFSLAVLSYEMLTNKTPFTSQQIAQSKKHLTFKMPHLINTQLPSHLNFVFERAFAVEPAARYQALSDFASDLKENAETFNSNFIPLLESNPVRFWQLTTALFILISILLCYLLFL